MRNLWYEVLNYANSREFRPFTFVTSSVLGLYPSTHTRLCPKNYSIHKISSVRPLVNQSCWVIFPLWKTYQTLASIPQLFIFLLPKKNNIFHSLQVLYSHEERVRQALELAEKDSSLTGNSRTEVQQRWNFFSHFLEKSRRRFVSLSPWSSWKNHAVLGYFEGYSHKLFWVDLFPPVCPFKSMTHHSQSWSISPNSVFMYECIDCCFGAKCLAFRENQ